MDFIKEVLKKDITKRILTLLIIGVFIFLIRKIINLFLLTFLFTYLMYSLQSYIHKVVGKIFVVKKVIVAILLYIVLIVLAAYAIYKFIPIAIHQLIYISNEVVEIVSNFDGRKYGNPILNYLVSMLEGLDVPTYIQGKSGYILKLAGSIGELGLDIFLALILSLFFILEKDRVTRFISAFKNSRISSFYNEMQYLGHKLLNSFGKVLQAQVLIALVNCILSIIGLGFLGFHQLLGLGVMIFLLSLIPVAGVIISLIPLTVIGYQIGGIMEVMYILILIIIIHAIESYFLNPKLMSVKTNLPVFFTFLVLIVSEHFMGIWGLIIGIPIFIFILDLLDVKVE